MKKQHSTVRVVAGFLAGALVGVPAVHATENYLRATPSTQPVYVNGQRVDLNAYSIQDANYVKLRDVGQLLNMNVYWDGASVQIDTASPYTGEAPRQITVPSTPPAPTVHADGSYTISVDHWSREDFSQQANSAVFTGPYTRELYNTVRQAMVDQGTDRSAGTGCAYCMVSKADYGAVKRAVGRIEGLMRYDHYVPKGFSNYFEWLDYYAVSITTHEPFLDAYDFIQPVIKKANGMSTDREKVRSFNDYVCDLLTYERDGCAGIPRIFSEHVEPLEDSCGGYANAFKFLCQAAGIPCMNVISSNHAWNLVYADGQWLYVDTTYNDTSGRRDYILLTPSVEGISKNFIDKAPEATEFLKELLVPGSTK